MPITPLNLVHLSDIHFSRIAEGGAILDRDRDLRDQLELDAGRLAKRMAGIHGILVTGDIAFSGKKEEYERAHQWLETLCATLSCEPENVWTTPGNHDVDRSVVAGSKQLELCHQEVRRQSIYDLDNRLVDLLSDGQMRAALFMPLQQYSEFGGRYGCDIGPDQPYWESDLLLNDRSRLRLRGLNSVLISGHRDDDGKNRLVLGSFQTSLTEQQGVAYVTLCHHPPQWLLDGDDVETMLRNRAKIQLFGHKHSQRLEQIEGTLRLTAGAVHPDRREPNWVPRYNILSVRVTGGPKRRRLVIDIYPRVWNDEFRSFVADQDRKGAEKRTYRLPLEDWYPPESASPRPPETAVVAPDRTVAVAPVTLPSDESGVFMDPKRRLTFRFLTLPYHRRIAIAQELGVWEEGDQHLSDPELFRLFFRRASDQQLVSRLWTAVEQEYPDGDVENNPFADRESG